MAVNKWTVASDTLANVLLEDLQAKLTEIKNLYERELKQGNTEKSQYWLGRLDSINLILSDIEFRAKQTKKFFDAVNRGEKRKDDYENLAIRIKQNRASQN